MHFNLESIVHLSDITLVLRHMHNIVRINRSFHYFYFSPCEKNNICFVNYVLMILLVFFPLLSLCLSLSFLIYLYLSPPAMINRDTRLTRSRVVSVVVFAETLQRCREKNACHFMGIRWHCGIYRRCEQLPTFENTKRIKCDFITTWMQIEYDISNIIFFC